MFKISDEAYIKCCPEYIANHFDTFGYPPVTAHELKRLCGRWNYWAKSSMHWMIAGWLSFGLTVGLGSTTGLPVYAMIIPILMFLFSIGQSFYGLEHCYRKHEQYWSHATNILWIKKYGHPYKAP